MSTNLENKVTKDVSTYEPSTRTSKPSTSTSSVRTPYQQTQVSEYDVIAYLENLGFKVKGKYIYKSASNGKAQEVCGNFNSNSIYFYASNNIYPFESGISYPFYKVVNNAPIVSNSELERIASQRKKELKNQPEKKVLSFKEYLDTTDEHHNFNLQNTLNEFHKFSKTNIIPIPKVWENANNVRGKWGKTYFPILNRKEVFNTAQVINYGSDLKRKRDQNIFYLSSKESIGLYRINLYDETKHTIIVESPKLAELGALILPNLNWLATMGKERLVNLDLSCINLRKTYLLPDFDGFDQWKELAVTTFNCGIVDIFQTEIESLNLEEQKKYSDLADLIVPFLQNKLSNDLIVSLYNIYASLINLALDDDYLKLQLSPQINEYNTELLFSEKKRKNIKFVSSIPKDFTENTKGNYKYSAQKGFSLKTEYIEIFQESFELISASFDICKEQTEEQFLNNLSKCFRVIRYLNSDSYIALFEIILAHINTKGNYNFSQKYVLDRLVPMWEEIDPTYTGDLIKVRNFNFLGGAELTNYEFLEEIRKAKKLYKIHSQLHAIKNVVKAGIDEMKFIEKKEIGLVKEAGNEYIFNLINRFNLASVGSIDKRICEVVKTLVTYNITINKGYYFLYNDKISVNEVSKRTGLNRVTLSNLLKFERNDDLIKSMYSEIEYLLDNYNSFEFEKINVKGKIHNSVKPIFKNEVPNIAVSPSEAFDYELNLENSVLECDIEEAYNKGALFFNSWVKYNKIEFEEQEQYFKQAKTISYIDLFDDVKEVA